MALDDNLIAELKHYGVTGLSDDASSVSFQEIRDELIDEVKSDIKTLRSVWSELGDVLSAMPEPSMPPNDVTQLAFARAVKSLYKDAKQHKNHLRRENCVLLRHLWSDSGGYSEAYCRSVIDYRLTISWLDSQIKTGIFLARIAHDISLEDKPEEEKVQKLAKSRIIRTAQDGPFTGGRYLSMEERAYPATGDNLEDGHRTLFPFGKRRTLPDKYKFNAGFVHVELRNLPYSFEDTDEQSPYPHRNILFQ